MIAKTKELPIPKREDYADDDEYDRAWDKYYTTCRKCGGEIDSTGHCPKYYAVNGGTCQ